MRSVRVFAHRGGRHEGLDGEQSLGHANAAIALGVHAIEVDLHRTQDGVIVCVHDPEHAGVVVADVSHSALTTASQLGGVASPPTLEAFLRCCAGRCDVDLELKVAGIEAEVLHMTADIVGLEHALFKSFDDGVVRRLKQLEPRCVAGLLVGRRVARYGVLSRLHELFPGMRLLACGADFVGPNHQLVRFGFVRRMHLAGFAVYPWTVNDERLACRLLDRGVDGLVTDEVAMALAMVAR